MYGCWAQVLCDRYTVFVAGRQWQGGRSPAPYDNMYECWAQVLCDRYTIIEAGHQWQGGRPPAPDDYTRSTVGYLVYDRQTLGAHVSSGSVLVARFVFLCVVRAQKSTKYGLLRSNLIVCLLDGIPT